MEELDDEVELNKNKIIEIDTGKINTISIKTKVIPEKAMTLSLALYKKFNTEGICSQNSVDELMLPPPARGAHSGNTCFLCVIIFWRHLKCFELWSFCF